MKKRIIIISVIAVLLIGAIAYAYIMFNPDPNFLIKLIAKDITLDENKSVSFTHTEDDELATAAIPVYLFKAPKSAEYSFVVSDVKADKDLNISMYVMDENMEDLLVTSNYDKDSDRYIMDAETAGTVYLQKDKEYFVMTDVLAADVNEVNFSGKINIKVSYAPEVEKPAEIHVGESVKMRLKTNEKRCVIFDPEESGFYRFDTNIVSKDASSSFSSISSITTENKTKISVTDGSCYLDGGREYCIWVTVNESPRKTSAVEVTCVKLETINAEGICNIDLTGETMIEYTASEDADIVIFSESDGDPRATLHDSPGFLLREDDNSGGTLGDNGKDFAMVFSADKGKVYRICVFGSFENCKLRIGKYTGDGSSLGPEDVEISQDEPVAAEGAEAEETGETEVTEEVPEA